MTLRMVGAVLNRRSFDLMVTLDLSFSLSFVSVVFAVLMGLDANGFELMKLIGDRGRVD